MRAVITVIGKDNVGILHQVSGVCAKYQANVLEGTQSVLMVDITAMTTDFTKLSDELNSLGETLGLSIHAMHEDIFNAMHRI